MKKSIVLGHPMGNQNVRAALDGLVRNDILLEFCTELAVFPGSLFDKLASIRPFRELKRRAFDESLRTSTSTYPLMEMARFLATKVRIGALTKHETGILSVDRVYRNFDNRVSSRLHRLLAMGARGVIAFEDCAEATFVTAKSIGLRCFYDLPIGYWRSARTLLEAEKERWPGWVPTLQNFEDSIEKLDRKDRELALADHVFVASSFTKATLRQYPGDLRSVEVIPYGFPSVRNSLRERDDSSRPLRLLFVGSLTQRKGIADLFEAVKSLRKYVELTLVGRKSVGNCEALNDSLKRHHWIPSLPHNEILHLMRINDVLVFPSLFEGFGLVITEAMSQGMPVITTNRTVGPDIIENGRNGWIIDAGSTESLKAAIETAISNRKGVYEAGHEAMMTASHRPWSLYGDELAASLSRHLNS